MSPSSEPTERAPRPLVDTGAAAEALRLSEHALNRLAEDGTVTPAKVDADGAKRWNLHDLRRELAAYLNELDEH